MKVISIWNALTEENVTEKVENVNVSMVMKVKHADVLCAKMDVTDMVSVKM
jgi:hypothetical protein